MKRRTFIGIAVAGAAGAVVPAVARDESVTEFLCEPRLLRVLPDERIVVDVGRRYRALAPHEDDAATLTRAIVGQERADASREFTDALRARIDAQVRDDFAAGRVVTVNGWILAVTEARQCALYSLLPA